MRYSLNNEHWTLISTLADEFDHPEALTDLEGISASVPGTVAQSLKHHQQLTEQPKIDSSDWWYLSQFDLPNSTTKNPLYLCLDGLATHAEVWLNGEMILRSDNMFVTHQVDVTALLQTSNRIAICFRSLEHFLKQRKPRPRWKTKLVKQQQLRWIRTTLLGRIPGWTPAIEAVGPWRGIEVRSGFTPIEEQCLARVKDDGGHLSYRALFPSLSDIQSASLHIDGQSFAVNVTPVESGVEFTAEINLSSVKLWWPHTHGEPFLYQVTLNIEAEQRVIQHSLPKVGFKTVTFEQSEQRSGFKVNGQGLFCRGACWTINDISSLAGEEQELRHSLELMKQAGANMIRIGGTMTYEQPLFYQLCDQLGIMVWQDFMFANMDYPFDDEPFLQSVNREVTQQLTRIAGHACLSVLCGNSEIEQQVAMLGFDESVRRLPFFEQQLQQQCAQFAAGIPYFSSTPTGGHLPFHCNAGIGHYYGIGAYLRPLSELRQHNVTFTSECLGFANVPVTKTRNQVLDGDMPVIHHPKWKQGTPRDSGTGWDFEDVRDHYFKTLFALEPSEVRYQDPETYMKLSELVSGEMMLQTFYEWRSHHSHCGGGLVWFLKDLVPGAGWGIIDNMGLPKACYYYLKRAWKPLSIAITNETLHGLDIHINNESTKACDLELEVLLLNHQDTLVCEQSQSVHVPAKDCVTLSADQLLGRFNDLAYVYRFGSAQHKLVAVRLKRNNETLDEAFFFPQAHPVTNKVDAQITCHIELMGEQVAQISITSDKFLYGVQLEINGFECSDNFFHLLPNTPKVVEVTSRDKLASQLKGYLSAINLHEEIRLRTN